MARRRMSLRAIASMKRENRALRETLSAVRHGGYGRTTRIVKVTLSDVEDAKIQTAHTLGYTTLLRDNNDGSFSVQAIALGES